MQTVISVVLLVLQLLTAWKVFEKYGEPGWKGIIPLYSALVEYGKVWSVGAAALYVVCWIVAAILGAIPAVGTILAAVFNLICFIINIMFANKKSKAFGQGIGTTLLLIFFPFIGNIYIGFSQNVQYQGNPQ